MSKMEILFDLVGYAGLIITIFSMWRLGSKKRIRRLALNAAGDNNVHERLEKLEANLDDDDRAIEIAAVECQLKELEYKHEARLDTCEKSLIQHSHKFDELSEATGKNKRLTDLLFADHQKMVRWDHVKMQDLTARLPDLQNNVDKLWDSVNNLARNKLSKSDAAPSTVHSVVTKGVEISADEVARRKFKKLKRV